MAGPSTNGNGQIQKRAEKRDMVSLLTAMSGEMARALPKHVTPDRMARVALTALKQNPQLMDCTPASFLGCIMQCAQLGLEPGTPLGHAYLIPYRVKGTPTCTLIIGYQGMLDLARRSGQVASVWAYPVYSGDRFVVRYGLAPTVEHEPALDGDRSPKALTHVYAAAKLRDSDTPVFVVLTRAEVEAFRKRGASGRGVSTPWDSDFAAMAIKTAVRQLFKWLPKSIELARAAVLDEAPETGRSQIAVMDEGVRDALTRQGHELPEDTGEVLDVAEVPGAIPAGVQREHEDGSLAEDPPG